VLRSDKVSGKGFFKVTDADEEIRIDFRQMFRFEEKMENVTAEYLDVQILHYICYQSTPNTLSL